jgi:hypothetical protein
LLHDLSPEIHKERSDKSIRLTRYATTDIFDKVYNGVEREEIKQGAHKLAEVFTLLLLKRKRSSLLCSLDSLEALFGLSLSCSNSYPAWGLIQS